MAQTSTSGTLFCPATKQAVHVAATSDDWFRGPDFPVVVGVFCLAHADRGLSVTTSFEDLRDANDYHLWTPDNARQSFFALTGRPIEKLPDTQVMLYL